jgi:hypothetical protein
MLGAARNDGWLHDDVTQAAEQSISSAVNMDAIAFTNALRIGPPHTEVPHGLHWTVWPVIPSRDWATSRLCTDLMNTSKQQVSTVTAAPIKACG